MFQVLFDHFFRHPPHSDTKIPSRPKMPTPIFLLQMGKLFKQITRCPTFNPPHNLTRRHLRRTTHKYMYMILTHHTPYNSYLECFARLSNQLPNSFCYFSLQNFVSIFSYPYKMIFNLINRMTSISIIHATPPVWHILSAKADRLKQGGFNLMMENNVLVN